MFRKNSFKFENENPNSEGEYSSYLKVFPCSGYFNVLRDVLSKATKYICIEEILLSSKEFSAIVRAAKHVKELSFTDCKIHTDAEYELGQMEECQIEFLQVYYCSHVYKHIRGYDESCLKIFLSILGCPNLLKSLRLNGIILYCREEMEKKLLSKAKEILGDDYDVLMPNFKRF